MNTQLSKRKIICATYLSLISVFFFLTKAPCQVKETHFEYTVIYTLGPDCPISQKYMHTIKNIYNSYKDRVNFFAVVPGNFKDLTISEFISNYKIPFDVKKDHQNHFINKYDLTVTPEVIVLNAKDKIVYQGAIDNWFYELGKNRRTVTDNYLDDTLTALLNNQTPSISKTKPIGCIIEN